LGDIVGTYEIDRIVHGFLLSHGVYTTIDFPGAAYTTPLDINDAGVVVGQYSPDNVHGYGYIQNGDTFVTINPADAYSSAINGINNTNAVAGYAEWMPQNGFAFAYWFDPGFHTLPLPEESFATIVGINDQMDLVGSYACEKPYCQQELSFAYINGQLEGTDYPGATATYNLGINSKGEIVGQYILSGVYYGFLRMPD
jgi:hypothetical protein